MLSSKLLYLLEIFLVLSHFASIRFWWLFFSFHCRPRNHLYELHTFTELQTRYHRITQLGYNFLLLWKAHPLQSFIPYLFISEPCLLLMQLFKFYWSTGRAQICPKLIADISFCFCFPSKQGHKEWLTEVNVLGVVEHPNLVKLVGYCADDDERGLQRLLVYEYMPNRSVEDHLSNRMNEPLSWDMRLRVALDAARGLTYLHEGMDFQVFYFIFQFNGTYEYLRKILSSYVWA